MSVLTIRENRDFLYHLRSLNSIWCRLFRTVPTLLEALLVLLLMPSFSESIWGKELDVVAIGIRGGINFKEAGLPPGEKEDFEQYDVFGIIGLPWSWEYPSSGW